MTLKFSESPAVQIKEIDLTGSVPAVTSTTGALVGDFNWGPVGTPILIGNETELAAVFGNPNAGTAGVEDFLSAAYFLKYSSSLYVVRALSLSDTAYDGNVYAKYPGSLGDEIVVSVCGAGADDGDANTNEFGTWAHAPLFTSEPTGTEVHVVVIVDGAVTETYEYVSTVSGAKTPNGTNNYIVDVIAARSSWIHLDAVPAAADYTLCDGTHVSPTVGEHVTAFDQFANKDAIQIDFLIASASKGEMVDVAAIHTAITAIAEQRKDCVAVASIDYNSARSGNASTYIATVNLDSSYLVLDSNWIRVYDKYNDKYVFIPAASSTAGVMAATDKVSAPWFSPAGSRRGQYLGVTELLHNPSKTSRDQTYKAGINPIVSLPGQGIMLFGDKTKQSRPSAFDRINVRRLFLTIERAISKAGENVMFEFNDEFTRAEFVNIVEPFLREIQGRRGITDFRLVCDETNNTAEVVDRNEFIASCFIKPARSINYVTLNFVAVRSGVDFEEVVGKGV
jgi:phage tail sheath protein FI